MNKYLTSCLLILPVFLLAQDPILDRLMTELNPKGNSGLSVSNVKTQENLYSYQGQHYFTPASNVKILTLYVALNHLPDSLILGEYKTVDKELYFKPYGDPTLFHKKFSNASFKELIQPYTRIHLDDKHFNVLPYAPGCSWEDYQESFQVERSVFPLYANRISIAPNRSYWPKSTTFKVLEKENTWSRELHKNTFYYTAPKDTLEIPFIFSRKLSHEILQNATGKEFKFTPFPLEGTGQLVYSEPKKEILQEMMLESNNFYAEQLLLMASQNTLGEMNSKRFIKQLQKTDFDFPQKPKWIDGSGLSRYNLISPEDFVSVLNQLQAHYPDYLDYFAQGGKSGTLKRSYQNPDSDLPYVYAKTGSMGGVYNLSGYLLTDKGNTLSFSFLNNHFNHRGSLLKTKITEVLEHLKHRY